VYYTGTPHGVAQVKPGDLLQIDCAPIGAFEIKVRAHQAGG
jgi:2-keto-4-pentenoate hydratase/2-oxohepta-3-ene-1,7-dioic acid hydratase in catechol pathway